MTKQKIVYGISGGAQQYDSGTIFTATAWKDSSPDEVLMAKDLGGVWTEVYGMFFINDSGEPQMAGWSQYIPEEK